MTSIRPPSDSTDRRAHRGDGSALASFLCPVCWHDALVEDVACRHLLLVQDRWGDVYCRDVRVRTLAREVEDATGGRGLASLEALCGRLGPGAMLYELLDDAGDGERPTSTFFVVDASGPAWNGLLDAAG